MPDFAFIQELKDSLRERYREYHETYVKPCRRIRKILEDVMYPDLETHSVSLAKVLRLPFSSHVDQLFEASLRSQIRNLERHIENFRRLMGRLAVDYRYHEEDLRLLRVALLDEVGSRNGLAEFMRMTAVPEHKVKGAFVVPEILDIEESEGEPSDAESVVSEERSVDDENSSLDGFVVADSNGEDSDESYDPSSDA
jgi:hypothetical protein